MSLKKGIILFQSDLIEDDRMKGELLYLDHLKYFGCNRIPSILGEYVFRLCI